MGEGVERRGGDLPLVSYHLFWKVVLWKSQIHINNWKWIWGGGGGRYRKLIANQQRNRGRRPYQNIRPGIHRVVTGLKSWKVGSCTSHRTMNPGDTPIHLHHPPCLNFHGGQNKTVSPPLCAWGPGLSPGCFVLRETMPISVINIGSDPHIMTSSLWAHVVMI